MSLHGLFSVRLCLRSAAALFFASAGPVVAEQAVHVVLDRATVIRITDGTSTIVVGNPLIADVSIAARATMVVTGKGYGLTNIKLLDQKGSVLEQYVVEVSVPVDAVIVYRGIAQNSYSCAPACEQRITLGDSPDYFDAATNQSVTRAARAMQQTSPSLPAPPPRPSGTAPPPL
jgi:Flp pilus assembly secretin CpaC